MVPRELYTLGAVRFDTQPIVKLQGELMAKKAAKEEALDKWIFDLQGKIPSGQVRAIDREPFQQKVAQWIKDGIAAKGKPGAQQSIMQGFQGLLADANESKAAGERQQKIAEIRLQSPDKIDEEDLPIIDNMSKSIYDPAFYKRPDLKQPYDLGDFSANIPTWDVGKRKQFIDFAISGVKPAGRANEKTVYDQPSFTNITTYEKVFTPKQIQDVTQKAIAVLSDRSGLKTYKQILREGEQQVPSDQFISLAKAYELVNPNDVMNTPLKVAQAEIALGMIGAKEDKTDKVFDREAYARYQSNLIASRGGEQKGAEEYDYYQEALDVPVKAIGSPLKDEKGRYKYPRITGRPINNLQPTAQERIINIAKAITGGDYTQKNLILTEDERGRLHIQSIVFEYPEKGDPIPVGTREITPITSLDLNLKPQVGVGEKRSVIKKAKEEKRGTYVGVDSEGNPIFED